MAGANGQQTQNMEMELQRRQMQKIDDSKGEPVWFSRRMYNGHLHRWALIAHGKTYEAQLIQMDHKDMLPNAKFARPVDPTYETDCSPLSFEDEVKTFGSNTGNTDYAFCQIGWTRLTTEQVDNAYTAVDSKMEQHRYKDYQSFFRQLAGRMVFSNAHAIDYPWFEKNLTTSYHHLQFVKLDEAAKSFQAQMQSLFPGDASAQQSTSPSSSGYTSQEQMTAIKKEWDEEKKEREKERKKADRDEKVETGCACCECCVAMSICCAAFQ